MASSRQHSTASVLFLALVISLIVSAIMVTISFAKDGKNWGRDPATSEWFRSLRSPLGVNCCASADGERIEDPDWFENEDGTYDVMARGEWWRIQKDHVVRGTNKVGFAILFWPPSFPEPSCFVPGSRGEVMSGAG